MTRYLLDTNIISNMIKPTPSPALTDWLPSQDDADLFISSWTLAEIERGILQMPVGRRRGTLESWFLGPSGPSEMFAGRILPFDEDAAHVWAELVAEGNRPGRPRSEPDMIIAAIAIANGCLLVTDNERHFAGVVPFLNPVR